MDCFDRLLHDNQGMHKERNAGGQKYNAGRQEQKNPQKH